MQEKKHLWFSFIHLFKKKKKLDTKKKEKTSVSADSAEWQHGYLLFWLITVYLRQMYQD